MVVHGMQCHCGAASLTKAEYFGEWIDVIDEELMQNCPSSDIVYSYLALRNKHPYIHTEKEYFMNVVQSSMEQDSYTSSFVKENGIAKTYNYLTNRFGKHDSPLADYIGEYMTNVITGILDDEVAEQLENMRILSETKVRSSKTYRVGNILLKPLKAIKNIIGNNVRGTDI